MKALLSIIILAVLTFGVDNNKRTDASTWLKLINVRTSDTIVKGYDSTRGISSDVGGIIMFRQKVGKDTIKNVITLNDATVYPITGIVEFKPLYNGSDSTTCQVYDSTGTLRRGIRIWR